MAEGRNAELTEDMVRILFFPAMGVTLLTPFPQNTSHTEEMFQVSKYTAERFWVVRPSYTLIGFNSEIIRLPWDNFGLAVLDNDYELGRIIAKVIQYRLLDEVLGLDPIDWVARFVFFLEKS
jgi:hypothetical protein